ncbi:ABC transporter, permease protein [Lachnospiraceae bacterium oral taxon 082 str. F0431]|nr:ABC transporter, permease protein [Lachnospiraceae bacterium oral taxon 082 str. F0431]
MEGIIVYEKRGRNKAISRIIVYTVLIFVACIMLIPFVWMLSSSLKLEKDVFSFPIQWIPKKLYWENYKVIWEKVPLFTGFINSIKITVVVTVLQILTSTFAAYSFAKLKFKGRDIIFMIYILTISVPWQVYMVPQFIMMSKFGLTDSHIGLIIMHTFTATGVFLIRQFYMGVPNELIEAARIDGLNEYGIYARIMLPLSKPAIATLCITTFTFEWNDFMGPLVYLSTNSKKTIQLMLRMFNTQYSSNYALIMAAAVISLMPVMILFLGLQKYFVEGIASTGIKG